MEIIPSIIATEFSEIKDKVEQVDGFVSWVEIDVMDGVFVPTVSWQGEEALVDLDGKAKISAHLMVEAPETLLDDWQAAVDRIVVHYEATGELDRIIDKFDGKNNPCEFGIALELETPLEKIYPYLSRVKIVQLMSVLNIGYYGEKFDQRIIDKVRTLRENWPDVKIVVDGGIDLKAATELKEAGANELVVGSHIWKSGDVSGAIKELQRI